MYEPCSCSIKFIVPKITKHLSSSMIPFSIHHTNFFVVLHNIYICCLQRTEFLLKINNTCSLQNSMNNCIRSIIQFYIVCTRIEIFFVLLLLTQYTGNYSVFGRGQVSPNFFLILNAITHQQTKNPPKNEQKYSFLKRCVFFDNAN